jgi:NAD-dependent SIR2 family protein deacetylase
MKKQEIKVKDFSKEEIKQMHHEGLLTYCPKCNRYYTSEEQQFPLYNMARCQKCEEKER